MPFINVVRMNTSQQPDSSCDNGWKQRELIKAGCLAGMTGTIRAMMIYSGEVKMSPDRHTLIGIVIAAVVWSACALLVFVPFFMCWGSYRKRGRQE